MNGPLVTVIVPCLNAEPTLGEALASVFAQTVPPEEVLVVDDGSTDRSVEVAHSFGPRVRVLRNPGRGPGAARRIGVTEARGRYIAFIDADDAIEPRKHELQLTELERCGGEVVAHTGSLFYWPDGSREPRVRVGAELAVGRCTQVVFERNPICGASSMLARRLIRELGNYDPELFGTEDFGMSLLASARWDFVYVPGPLYRIRQHGTNLTRRRCHMAYYHWLAQERFRQRCPEAFAALPAESVQRYMIEPVVRTAKAAYVQRDERDYLKVLRLARRLAPEDADLQRLWRRRYVPMGVLRTWDRVQRMVGLTSVVET